MKKEMIHHVDDARGDPVKIAAHTNHALAQVKAGHYRLENLKQEQVEPGRVRLTFDRVETDMSATPAPPSVK
jgi:hypothetical protein